MKIQTIIFLMLFTLLACQKDDDTPIIDEEYEIIQINSDWFDVSYTSPKTYIIEEPQSSEGNVSYLMIGDDKAIMFDTGTGENPPENGFKIKHIINQLTSLPTTLLLSHFHYDHNQNISEFDWIGFPNIPHLVQSVSSDSIYQFTSQDLIIGNSPEQVKINEWLPLETDIDLGNRIIQLVNIPGHSLESIAIIDKTNKLAFLGDFLYNGEILLWDTNDLSIYEESVDHLISILDSDYKLYGAHGTPEVAFGKLQKLKDFFACINDNTCQGVNSSFFGEPVLEYNFEGMVIMIFL
jgi:hydroxyacylglutathione hydrolase